MTEAAVLIADDDPVFLELLEHRCREAFGLHVRTASDGLEALMSIAADPPDLAIIDVTMPGTDGLTLCDKLARGGRLAELPVIILTQRSDAEVRQRCQALGVGYCHKGLDVWRDLKPQISEALAFDADAATSASAPAAAPTRPKLLVVDDDPMITKFVWAVLGPLGVEVLRAPNAKAGLLLARGERPDLILTDYNMPEINGEQFLIELKRSGTTADIPVVVMTASRVDGRENFALQREMLGRRGAAAFLTKPVDVAALVETLKAFIPLSEPSAAAVPTPAPVAPFRRAQER